MSEFTRDDFLGITILTGMFVKRPTKSAILAHVLFEGRTTNLIHGFELKFKKSLIYCDIPILSKNVYSIPSKLFHEVIYYYSIAYHCIIDPVSVYRRLCNKIYFNVSIE